MGSVSAKPSPPLTQTLVPPSQPIAPPTTSQQLPPCPESTPTVRHAEWDECMRQSILTIGSTTVTAIVIGLMVPAADTLLLLGTGAGVLWSVKRCRTLLRDGILSPEETKALEYKKRAEKEEKRRQRKMEKEAKQRAAAERKLLEKQKKLENKERGSNECCTKLKKMMEQKGISVDNVPCDKLSHKNQGHPFNVETALAVGSQLADHLKPQGHTLQEDHPTSQNGPIRKVSCIEEEGESPRILTEKTERVNPKHLKSSGAEKRVKRPDTDTYSTVKLFAPHSQYLSESVILTCDSEKCTCNSNKSDLNCTCDSTQLSYGEPQQYTLATDAENEDPPLKEEYPANLAVQPVNSVAEDMAELERNTEVQVSVQRASDGDSSESMNDVLEQPAEEHDQIDVQESEVDEVEVILSPAFESIEPVNNESSIELIIEESEDLDIKIEESKDGFDITVIQNDIGDEQLEQLKNEVDEVFAETYKSESWPFSFSLPSLEKFSKKKNNSFKWPPLTSSIIVKQKKEPDCKTPDNFGAPKENGNTHKGCTCGSPKNDCTCP